MPSYDYQCKADECKHEWESVAKISDPVEIVCPKCKQETAQRLISSGNGFVLNGGGWARDSYNGSSNNK